MTLRVRSAVRGFGRPLALLAGVALAATAVAAPAGASGAAASTPPAPSMHRFSAAAKSFIGAHTVADRVAKLEAATSTLPRESFAYNATKLWNQGITGAGTTVTTLVSYGDDQVKQVLDEYSQRHGLPPADVEVLQPSGAVPACTDPGVDTATCESWGGETDLDVTMMHAMAPGAKIIVAATPVAETRASPGCPR
ncbi:hypothetical protein ACWEOE_24475 [Amycolatopsis sp. NPDC004368]